jgi:hypothetical protein
MCESLVNLSAFVIWAGGILNQQVLQDRKLGCNLGMVFYCLKIGNFKCANSTGFVRVWQFVVWK